MTHSSLAALRGGDLGAERRQLLERVDSETTEPLHQTVEDVDRGAGVGQRPVVGRRRGVKGAGQG